MKAENLKRINWGGMLLFVLGILFGFADASALAAAAAPVVSDGLADAGRHVQDTAVDTPITNAESPELLDKAIDERVVRILPEDHIFDIIARTNGRSVNINSLTYRYYSVDTLPNSAKVTTALSVGSTATSKLVVDNPDHFAVKDTILVPSVNGFDRTIYEDNKKAREDAEKEQKRQFDEMMRYRWAALNAKKSANGQGNRKMVAFYNPVTQQPVYFENDNHTADMLTNRFFNKITEEKYLIPSVVEALTYLGRDVKIEDLIKEDEHGNETVDTAKLNLLYKSLTPEDKWSFVNMMIDRSPQATKALLEAAGYDLEQDNIKSWFNGTFGIRSPYWVSDGKIRITVPNGEYEDFIVPNDMQGFEQAADTVSARRKRNPKYRSSNEPDNPDEWGDSNSKMIEDYLKRNAQQGEEQDNGVVLNWGNLEKAMNGNNH